MLIIISPQLSSGDNFCDNEAKNCGKSENGWWASLKQREKHWPLWEFIPLSKIVQMKHWQFYYLLDCNKPKFNIIFSLQLLFWSILKDYVLHVRKYKMQ